MFTSTVTEPKVVTSNAAHSALRRSHNDHQLKMDCAMAQAFNC